MTVKTSIQLLLQANALDYLRDQYKAKENQRSCSEAGEKEVEKKAKKKPTHGRLG